MTQKPINDVIDTSKELLRDIDLSKLPESIINLLVRLREALTAYEQEQKEQDKVDEIPGESNVITGYKCKLCGYIGKFEDFPTFTIKDEDGLKYSDIYCPKCDAVNDELEEIIEPYRPVPDPKEEQKPDETVDEAKVLYDELRAIS